MPLGGFKIPGATKSVLVQEVKKWGPGAVTVTASGLFPVERALAAATPLKVYGSDLDLIPCCIGDYYSGGKVEVGVSPAYAEELDWLAPFMETPVARLATVMLFKDLALSWLKRGANPFYARIADAYRKQFPALHGKQVIRLEGTEFKLAGFSRASVMDAIHAAPTEHGLILIPPQPLGLDRNVQDLFGWDVDPQPWKKPQLIEAVDAMRAKTDRWALITFGEEIAGLEECLVGRAQTTNRGAVSWVYAGRHENAPRLVTPHQEIIPYLVPRLAPTDEITPESTIAIRPITGGEFQALRSQYLNRNIKPAAASSGYVVLVDGKVAGSFAFAEGDSQVQGAFRGKIPLPAVYQLSDFPVEPTQYKRLAKLIVLAAASLESRTLARQQFQKKISGVVTTAFCKKPVSMKYRGVLELISRKEEGDKSDVNGRPYKLNYGLEMGKWTLKEALRIWCEKHSVKGTRPEAD
jgi:hypothetical protein